MMEQSLVKLVSFNCKSIHRSIDCVRSLCQSADIIALQETWLLPHDVAFLGTIHNEFAFTGKSAVDTSSGVVRGRPYGGVALIWRRSLFTSVSVIECNSVRLVAAKVIVAGRAFLIFSVYMPTDSVDNLNEFTECLSEISAIIENENVESVYVLGDFNAHPGERFGVELLDFCSEQKWLCADILKLGQNSDTYTFVSDAHDNCRRWLDHCVVTEAALRTIIDVKVNCDVFWSDHLPLEITCNLKILQTKMVSNKIVNNRVKWGIRDASQIKKFHELCHNEMREVGFPSIFHECCDNVCHNIDHRVHIDSLYSAVVSILSESAAATCSRPADWKRRYVTGWNRHVKEAHAQARLCFQLWVQYGKPGAGPIYTKMCETRKAFKAKLKWCQNNEQKIKMEIIATHHSARNFGSFWREAKKLNPKSSLPLSVAGRTEPVDIANLFQQQFKVESPLGRVNQTANMSCKNLSVRFSARDVSSVIKNMSRGKSPGHDSLSIEHLQNAGVHLPRILSLLFNLCISHSYLPVDLVRTVVVPVPKNKTGDMSDTTNYRPISLATITAKVLDSLLDKYLAKHLNIDDRQFGFRNGLSTETAIMTLKSTVQYYTGRRTPVYACFLDLSRAFDLVSYDILWNKLSSETSLPPEIINVFKFWYSNQHNTVRWADSYSDVYRLECGVRQGGLTSPKLFNLYVNKLIEELSSSGVGCMMDGVSFNNISYADDMVLLSPSISALRKLLNICESYAGAHGLRYNAKKSELLVFKAHNKTYEIVPQVSLCGTVLNRVKQFKYLGHWVTEDGSDTCDMERERRALAVRCNMLAHRFARCDSNVKITLFRAYCQSFYTCSLWTRYTLKTYNALRVQYNNAFRILLSLPRFCSASGMFAEARTDDFFAIMRKRSASLLRRLRDSANSLLNVIVSKTEGNLMGHLCAMHVLQPGVPRGW